MCKRFWVGLITCLFATFFILPFVAISGEECKQGICAGAWVRGSSSKPISKARVSSTASYDGRWAYRVVAGQFDEGGAEVYRRGFSRTWSVSDYTSTAWAYASNYAKRRSTGKIYYASGYDSKNDN